MTCLWVAKYTRAWCWLMAKALACNPSGPGSIPAAVESNELVSCSVHGGKNSLVMIDLTPSYCRIKSLLRHSLSVKVHSERNRELKLTLTTKIVKQFQLFYRTGLGTSITARQKFGRRCEIEPLVENRNLI